MMSWSFTGIPRKSVPSRNARARRKNRRFLFPETPSRPLASQTEAAASGRAGRARKRSTDRRRRALLFRSLAVLRNRFRPDLDLPRCDFAQRRNPGLVSLRVGDGSVAAQKLLRPARRQPHERETVGLFFQAIC